MQSLHVAGVWRWSAGSAIPDARASGVHATALARSGCVQSWWTRGPASSCPARATQRTAAGTGQPAGTARTIGAGLSCRSLLAWRQHAGAQAVVPRKTEAAHHHDLIGLPAHLDIERVKGRAAAHDRDSALVKQRVPR